MKSNENNLFKTSEFILICTLVYNGVVVKEFESDPINPRRAVAVFAYSKKLETEKAKLLEGKTKVEPVRFWATVREVKGRIRASLGQDQWN